MHVTRRSLLVAAAASAGALLMPRVPAFAQARSFQDKDLSGQSMVGANLPGADFTGATLRNTDFSRANLAGAIFTDADLRNAVFSGANMSGVDFRDAVLPFIAMTANPVQNFQRCNMEGLDLKGNTFNYCNLNGANLRNTTNWGQVAECSFRGADLRGANLGGAHSAGGDPGRQFAGAIYDDSTNWPAWVDPESVRARKM